jgi:hypothetical protein
MNEKNVRHVSQEKFNEVCRLLDIARRCDEQAKLPGLSLAAKLALQREASKLREQARS